MLASEGKTLPLAFFGYLSSGAQAEDTPGDGGKLWAHALICVVVVPYETEIFQMGNLEKRSVVVWEEIINFTDYVSMVGTKLLSNYNVPRIRTRCICDE